MTLEVQRTADAVTLRLSGDWGVREFGTLEKDFAGIDVRGAHTLVIDTAGLTSLDLTGAWSLHEFVRRTRGAGVTVSFAGSPPDQLRLLDETLKQTDAAALPPQPAAAAAAPAGRIARLLARLGRETLTFVDHSIESLTFLGRTAVSGLGSFSRLKRLRPISIARHVYDTGVTALPIVALIAFLISVIIAYMSATAAARVRRGHLRRGPGDHRRAARAGRAADRDHRRRPLGQRLRRRDRLDAAQRGGRRADRHRRRSLRGAGRAARHRTGDRAAAADHRRRRRRHSRRRAAVPLLLDMPLTQFIARANEAISPTTFWVGHHQGAGVRGADRHGRHAIAACRCATRRASSGA